MSYNDDGPSTSWQQESTPFDDGDGELEPWPDDESDHEANYDGLMTTETEDLLKKVRQAYEKKIGTSTSGRNRGKPPTREVEVEHESDATDGEEVTDEENEIDESFDDPNDADYVPGGKKRRAKAGGQSSRSKAGGKEQRSKSGTKKRSGASNVVSGKNKVLGTFSWDDEMSDSSQEATSPRRRTPGAPWNDGPIWSDDEYDDCQPVRRPRMRKVPPEVESLLGQANVSFAQGRSEEALKMVEEVVRSRPGYYESYNLLSLFYGMLGNKSKQLHFGLLAAHLDSGASAEKWAELAEIAVETGETDQAIRCYSKAHRLERTKWEYYEAKINLLEKTAFNVDNGPVGSRLSILKQIAHTKLSAVKGLRLKSDLSTDDYVTFARTIFQQLYAANDNRRAVSCLKCILERIQSDREEVNYEYLNYLINLSMHTKEYEDALLAVFRYSKLQAYNDDNPVNLREDKFSERMEPHQCWRPLTGAEGERIRITHYTVPEGFPVDMMAKTIACWLRLKRYDSCQPLYEMLKSEVPISSAPEAYWEIAEALTDGLWYDEAESLLEQIVLTPEYENCSSAWLCYAEVLSAQGKLESGATAFERVVQLSPYHVGARLNLSALQQQLGQTEEALQTLDIGDGQVLEVERLDERLLYQRCVLLRQQESWDQFLTTACYLMAMYFKDAYSPTAWIAASSMKCGKWKITQRFRFVVLDEVKNTKWESLVQRMTALETITVPADEIWEIFFRMCELMLERGMITDLLYVACYASQCPIFLRQHNLRKILTLLLLMGLLKRHPKVVWSTLRQCVPTDDTNALWNVYGLLFVFSQEISYHKVTLRTMFRMPESVALAWMSGNNSLITGTYQHALAEYLYILQRRPEDPLLNLLIGLSFCHIAAKKYTARRHDIFIQGMAFLSKYEDLRGPCQEVYYNIGRAFHQAGILYAAVHYYQKGLTIEPPTIRRPSKSMKEGHKGVGENIYDLRPIIAHNLALIFESSENTVMARELLERYCVVE